MVGYLFRIIRIFTHHLRIEIFCSSFCLTFSGSLVRPKVVRSVHYCPATKKSIERRYTDLTSLEAFPSNAVYPTKVILLSCLSHHLQIANRLFVFFSNQLHFYRENLTFKLSLDLSLMFCVFWPFCHVIKEFIRKY